MRGAPADEAANPARVVLILRKKKPGSPGEAELEPAQVASTKRRNNSERLREAVLNPKQVAPKKRRKKAERAAEAMQGEKTQTSGKNPPPFLPDLVRLEDSIHKAKNKECSFVQKDHPTINPSLELVLLSRKNLPAFRTSGKEPEQGEEFVMVFRHPKTGELILEAASDEHLLALKLVVEAVSSREAADQCGVSVARVDSALDKAFREGLLLAPHSKSSVIQKPFL